MFERFTKQARSVVKAAVEIAGRHGSDRVGADHLLLAVATAPGPGPASEVLSRLGATPAALEAVIATNAPDAALLAKLGIDLDEVVRAAETSFGPGAWARRDRHGHLPFTPDAKKALELSLRHALALKSKTIQADHVLLGVLDSGRVVTDALRVLALEPQQVKRRLLDELKAAS